MSQSLRALLQSKGGADFHLIWIQYFTLPNNLKQPENSERAPADDFLFACKYTPVPTKKIKSAISKCHNSDEITEALAELFDLKSISLGDMAVVGQSQMNRESAVLSGKNDQEIPNFVFRGFIALSYVFPTLVKTLASPKKITGSIGLYEHIVHYVASQPGLSVDFVKAVQPILMALKGQEKVFCAGSSDVLLYKFVVQVMRGIVSNLFTVYESRLWVCLSFAVHAFRLIFSRSTALTDADPYVPMYSAFIQMSATYFGKDVAPERQEKIVQMISCFFLRFRKVTDQLTVQFQAQQGLDSLKLLGKLNVDYSNELSEGVLYFLVWYQKSVTLDNIFDDCKEDEEPPEPLHFETEHEYLTTHRFFQVPEKFKKSNVSQLHEILIPVVVRAEKNDAFYEVFAERLKWFQPSSLIVLVSAMARNANALSKKSLSLVKAVITKFSASKTGADLRLRQATMELLFGIFVENEKARLAILNMLSSLKSSDLFVMFLPLLRTLLLRDDDVHFVSCLMQSNLPERLEIIVTKEGQENITDRVMAFLQQVMITRPILTFTSMSLVGIFAAMVTYTRYQDLVIKSFKVGLQIGSQSKDANSTVLQQVASVLVQIAEQPSARSLVADLIQYITESLPRFSKEELDSVEFKTLIDLVPTLPNMTEDNCCLLATLRLISLIYDKFTRIIDVFEESACYTHLKSALSVIQLRKESMDLMMKIRSQKCRRLLMEAVQGTEFELDYMKELILECEAPAHAFEFSECGVLSYALSRTSVPELIDVALRLYVSVGTSFYSPLALTDFLASVRTSSSQAKVTKLESFLRMIKTETDHISSFFHMNDRVRSGIFGPSTDKIGKEWSFAAKLRIDEPSFTLLSLTDEELTSVDFVVNKQILCVKRKSGEEEITKKFDVELPLNLWFNMMIIVGLKSISLCINGEVKGIIKYNEKLISGGTQMLKIADGFIGDLGPVTLSSSTDKDSVNFDNPTRDANTICLYLPRYCHGSDIYDVVIGQSAKLFGNTVLFSTTARNILKLHGTSEKLVSLFYHIDSGKMYYLLLCILAEVMTFSDCFEEDFEAIGGFQLFSGIIRKNKFFTEPIAKHFGLIFGKLKSPILKKQFIEFIVLNFDVFDGGKVSGSVAFYNKIAPTIIKMCPALFKFDNLDFLLYQAQDGIDVAGKKLREAQFDFLNLVIELNPSKKLFYTLFLILDFTNDDFVRRRIVDIFERFLRTEDKDVVDIFQVLNYCEKFYSLFGAADPALHESALNLIGTIVNMAKKQNKKLSLVKATRFLGRCEEAIAVGLCCRLFGKNSLDECQSFVAGEYLPLVLASLHLCEGVTKESIYVLVMVNVVKNIDFVLENMADPLFFVLFAIQGDRFDAALCAELCARSPSLVDGFIDVFEVIACVTGTNVTEWKYRFLMELLNHVSTNSAARTDMLVKAVRSAFYDFVVTDGYKEETPRLPFSSAQTTDLIGHISNPGDIEHVSFTYQPVTTFHGGYLKILWTNLLGLIEDDFQCKVQFSGSLKIEVFKILAVVSYLLIKEDPSQERAVVEKIKQITQQFPSLDASKACLKMLASVSSSIMPNCDVSPSLEMFNDFMQIVSEQAAELTSERQKSIIVAAEKMADMLRPPSAETDLNEKRFEHFTRSGSEHRCYVSEYSQKLSQSLHQKIEMSRAPADLKWKCTVRHDTVGRPVFMSVNDRFDDHRKASALRDSEQLNEGDQEQIVPFKYLLSPSVTVPNSRATARSAQSLPATLITVAGHYFGTLAVENNIIKYSGIKKLNGLGVEVGETERYPKIVQIKISDVEFIFNRIVMLGDNCCEIFTKHRKSYLLSLENTDMRNNFYSMVGKCSMAKSKSKRYDFFEQLRTSCKSLSQNCSSQDLLVKSKIVDRWRNGHMSNYQYLFYLNILANRSFNDLSQYPVFPWILSNYSSETLDLSDPSIYRDLSKPIGKLNEERLSSIKTMLEELMDPNERCLYRMHYSSTAMVAGYLIRTEPFASLHILLQSDRFDHPDRIFDSVAGTWNQVTSISHDFRELIPQFFCFSEMFVNENGFCFGKKMTGELVDDVVLPKWANSAFHFVEQHRQALESDYVRENLNHWIDLIFGCYQRSEEQDNVFHCYSYLDCVSSITDPEELHLAKTHNAIFGCCPAKLFDQKHPDRDMTSPVLPEVGDLPTGKKILLFERGMVICEDGFGINVISGDKMNFPIDKSQYCDYIYIPTTKQLVAVSKNRASGRAFGAKGIAEFAQSGSTIQCISSVDNTYVVTAGSDCLIYVWRIPSFTLEFTVPIQSGNITSISGSRVLDVIACVNERHQVFVSYLSARKTTVVFPVLCEPNATHRIELLNNGVIAVTCENIEITAIHVKFFDLRGKQLGEIPVGDRIVKMFGIQTDRSETYLILTTTKRVVTVVNCSSFTVQKVFAERPQPHLVSELVGRSLILSGIAKDRQSVVVTF